MSHHPVVLRLAQGEPGHVVVVQTAYLGDVVFTSPLVAALRARFPRATLTFCATPKGCEIAEVIPGVDRAVPFDKRGQDAGLGFLRVAAALRPVDVAVVAHASPRSALLARSLRPKVCVGFRSMLANLLYDATEPWDTGVTHPERYLRLARALGAEGGPTLALRLPDASQPIGTPNERPAVALVIGSEWGTKRWLPERYGDVANGLASAGFAPVLIGAPVERPLAALVMAAAAPASAVIDRVGESVRDSLRTLSGCRAVVGGDSGLVHAARAMGVPTVALFGPTDPKAHLFEATTQVLRAGVPCQPCHPHGPPTCPLGHHDCMKKIAADTVTRAVLAAVGAHA